MTYFSHLHFESSSGCWHKIVMSFSGNYAVITLILVLVYSCLAHGQKLLLVKHSYNNSSLNILNETPLHLSAERKNIVGSRKLLEDII